MSWEHVPGYVSEKEAHGEQTVVVEPERLVEAALHLRDEEGFSFLSDISATDYLGWGQKGVAGYIGTDTGRDLNAPGSQGLAKLPEPKPKRFAMNYHLLAVPSARRVRVQVWLDEDEPVPSVVPIWPDTFGLACCAIEMMSIVSSRYDIARFGAEVFRSSPRQADLLIVSGRVAHKMAAPLRQIYDQMLEPKWVIAMGACASSGGMFNNYTTLQGVDKIVAVDIYVPGCPPRPEALVEGIVRLQEKIKAGVPPAYEIRGVAS